MRQLPSVKSSCAALPLVIFLVAAGPASLDRRSPSEGVRVDLLAQIPAGVPSRVWARTAPGVSLPQDLRRALEQQLLAEWPAAPAYGSLEGGVALTLEPPLGNFSLAGGVAVPIVAGAPLEIAGRVGRAVDAERRRVVIIVDASASSNAPVEEAGQGAGSVLAIEREALRRVLESLPRLNQRETLEVGIVAFGETTWEVAQPTSDYPALLAALDEFEAAHPVGHGRTDTGCALWPAFERLDHRNPGTDNEIVLLTDGDLPHSGRFLDCSARRSERERRVCMARRNRTSCPAPARVRSKGRSSDLRELNRLTRLFAGRARVSPVVFQASRRTNAYSRLARGTRGTAIEATSIGALTTALGPSVLGRVDSVLAQNLTSGTRASDLLGPDGVLSGALPLVAGANDVELFVDAGMGRSARYRFRVYSASREVEEYLQALRSRNLALQARLDALQGEARRRSSARRATRRVEVVAEP